MKLCAAQLHSIPGDIPVNLIAHGRLIDRALEGDAEFIVFPELSLTGYEPAIAKELAIHPNDERLDIFQQIADNKNVTIAIGAPTRHSGGIHISLIVFQADQKRYVYSKQHLHPDEKSFFVAGPPAAGLLGRENEIALAICYELSIPEHARRAADHGARIYLASVAKTPSGVDQAAVRLAEIARQYGMMVLMSNCVGTCEGQKAGGRSSAWDAKGSLAGQLGGSSEDVLFFETA